MSKAKTVLKALNEGMHFNTKIKLLEADHSPTKVGLALKEANRMIENILNSEHPSANPVSDDDRKLLEKCSKKIMEARVGVRGVRVAKRMPK